MCETDPYGVECDFKEVAEEKDGVCCDSRKEGFDQRNCRRVIYDETYPDRRETGPLIHSPPNSKYLMQPSRRIERFSSMKRLNRVEYKYKRKAYHRHRKDHIVQH